MHAEIEAALVKWWEVAVPVADAEWQHRYSPQTRKDAHSRMVRAEKQARDELLEIIEKHHGQPHTLAVCDEEADPSNGAA